MKNKFKISIITCLLIAFTTSCGNNDVIGSVYGVEYEYISIDNDTFTLCTDSGYHANDRNKKIGIIEPNGENNDPMIVYSIKGVDDNNYIYVLWLYDGYIYKKDTE